MYNWDSEAMGVDFPRKGSAENKLEYAAAISRAQEVIITRDAEWVTNTRAVIERQNNQRKIEALQFAMCLWLLDLLDIEGNKKERKPCFKQILM